MEKATEYHRNDEDELFMQLGAQVRIPETGHVDGSGAIECRRRGSVAEADQRFLKADLCKDHGNGLEVVCIEKYYQDVAPGELPKPDVVAMFSPGFPQMARRTWDQVLRKVLADDVPFMVGDLSQAGSADGVFSSARPGSSRSVNPWDDEYGMTFGTMQAYGARSLGAFQNPFPILINNHHRHRRDSVIAKNAVLQVFCGRLDGAEPLEMPSKEAVAARIKFLTALNLDVAMGHEVVQLLKTSMLVPTTAAYDKAMWQWYSVRIRDLVQWEIEHNKSIDKAWMTSVKELGLTGKPRLTPWSLQEWIFVITQIPGIH